MHMNPRMFSQISAWKNDFENKRKEKYFKATTLWYHEAFMKYVKDDSY